MTKDKPRKEGNSIALDPNPKGELKLLGGGQSDKWNLRLVSLLTNALPLTQSDNKEAVLAAASAICQATADIAPADPIEGILVAQLMAANEAALSMYQRGWSQPPEYFQARIKYLQLADKAARTVLMLTERLDHHRGRGQQQIVVKHVTVKADQALVTDSVVMGSSGGRARLPSPANEPMAVLEAAQPVAVGGGTKSK